jgi:hypothetical protein
MPDAIPPDELELLDAAFAELRTFALDFIAAVDWYPRLLLGLLDAALREYDHLKLGLRHSDPMVAWACRNLLEVHIWTRYVLASEANARRFVAERLNDGVETYDVFQTWLARNDPSLIPVGLDNALRDLADERSDAGMAETLPLRMKRVAADAGLADEYANMIRLTAKLAHPNAFSILAGVERERVAGMTPILFRAGAGHGLEIYRLIREESGYSPRSGD